MTKNIILTGSEGFLGKYICEHMRKNDYNIISIDKLNLERKNYYKTDLSKSLDINKTLELSLSLLFSHLGHVATLTESYRVKINGFLYPNFMQIPKM